MQTPALAVIALCALCACVITVRPITPPWSPAPAAPAPAAEEPFTPPASTDEGALPTDLLVRGVQVFEERCAVCHGERGRGDGALADVLATRPRNYHQESFRWGTRPSQIVETISLGRSGIMPSFHGVLSEREMWSVAYLVWSWIPPDTRETDTAESLASWKLPQPPAAAQ